MWHGLKNFMSRLRRTLRRDRKQEIVELLGRLYADKMKDARQFRLHAEQMRYEHFRSQLRRICVNTSPTFDPFRQTFGRSGTMFQSRHNPAARSVNVRN